MAKTWLCSTLGITVAADGSLSHKVPLSRENLRKVYLLFSRLPPLGQDKMKALSSMARDVFEMQSPSSDGWKHPSNLRGHLEKLYSEYRKKFGKAKSAFGETVLPWFFHENEEAVGKVQRGNEVEEDEDESVGAQNEAPNAAPPTLLANVPNTLAPSSTRPGSSTAAPMFPQRSTYQNTNFAARAVAKVLARPSADQPATAGAAIPHYGINIQHQSAYEHRHLTEEEILQQARKKARPLPFKPPRQVQKPSK